MTASPPFAKSSKRSLPMAASPPRLDRHPKDDWQKADPYRLGSWATRALHAIVLAVVPPPPAPQPENLVERVADTIKSWMPFMHPMAARGLWLAMLILDFAPLFLFYRFSRLHKLERGDAAALLSEMVHGRYSFLRLLVVALRGVVLSAYFDQDEVHAAMQYTPVPFMQKRIALRQRLLEPAHAES